MKQRNRGLIGIILIIIIALLVISYFNINLQTVVQKPTTQQNFTYVASTSTSFWNTYLQKPASYLWNTVFIGLLWSSFINEMTLIKNGQPTTLQQQAPTISTP